MKKYLHIFSIIVLICCLCACGGDISNLEVEIGESEIYEDAEIRQAMDVVIKRFRFGFSGCDMTKLWYDEESSLKEADEWAERYNAEQAIVLFSNFNVDETGVENGFNPNSTYNNWAWILVRNNSTWKLKTWGYG